MIRSPYGNVVEVLNVRDEGGVTLLLKHEDNHECEYLLCELVADGGFKEISEAISKMKK